jgi:nicotinate phosphoribosyltransferase
MAKAYFDSGKHLESAVFEVLFRKNPFKGEYTIFAGLNEVLLFLK